MSLYRNIFCLLAPNGDRTPSVLVLPRTLGRWRATRPVALALRRGPNLLRFTRATPPCGLTIKQLPLKPVR